MDGITTTVLNKWALEFALTLTCHPVSVTSGIFLDYDYKSTLIFIIKKNLTLFWVYEKNSPEDSIQMSDSIIFLVP